MLKYANIIYIAHHHIFQWFSKDLSDNLGFSGTEWSDESFENHWKMWWCTMYVM